MSSRILMNHIVNTISCANVLPTGTYLAVTEQVFPKLEPMHIPTVSSFLALFLTPHVFQSSLSIVESEGHIPFTVDGDVYQTYFKIFGDIGHRTRTPVVIVHGGPGLSHDYLLPHADLANHSYPVIFYDQIGNARSTHLPNKPPAFWSIDLFLDELDNLLRYFGIQDEFHIVGHSWGGMMAAEYVLRRHPAGLQRLVIADSPPDIGLWRQSFKELLKEFPQSVQDAIMRGPDKDLEAYYDAVKQFYTVHGCRVRPWPDELARSMEFEYGEDGDRTVARAK